MMLESKLGHREIILAGLDFRPLIIFLRIMNLPSFLELFSRNGLNLYPLFRTSLLRGFIGNSIPKCYIVEKSTTRWIDETNPNLLITFLEHFPHSRAMYSALKGTSTSAWSVQHASYSSGKTFVALHRDKEFDDQPDNQSVPHPNKVFVMGELGNKIFRDCGYAEDQIHITGSPRYDHVQKPVIAHAPYRSHMRNLGKRKNVLVVTSLPAVTELELVQAVVEACRGLDDFFIITLRAHPFGKFEKFSDYQLIQDAIQVSDVSLNEDIKKADLIIISQSTVGEEAFLAGKPVWQFRLRYPDQSALAEVSAIPRFYTVSELRSALVMFAESNESFAVPSEALDHVYRSLFQISEKAPSVAIAGIIAAELN
jgi:surface carbohydrate biosynthesis protein (TIGR04326 family)